MNYYEYTIVDSNGDTVIEGWVRARTDADARNWARDAEGIDRDNDSVSVELEQPDETPDWV